MVKLSEVFTVGALFDAVMVVVVVMRDALVPVLTGHAAARLLTST
jgi:hypothetical protein